MKTIERKKDWFKLRIGSLVFTIRWSPDAKSSSYALWDRPKMQRLLFGGDLQIHLWKDS